MTSDTNIKSISIVKKKIKKKIKLLNKKKYLLNNIKKGEAHSLILKSDGDLLVCGK